MVRWLILLLIGAILLVGGGFGGYWWGSGQGGGQEEVEEPSLFCEGALARRVTWIASDQGILVLNSPFDAAGKNVYKNIERDIEQYCGIKVR